ncbi:hypothetical protein HXX76_004344 [Chlamydomonas incerta]|uniref:Uncharacterized protein n=1 Tax=Chlamydomonas incerta TaxID=51695 RepID=A0A835W4G1_CHLIN|nr:hypothetical protein HXX76_004344 [Chlamydomonas incerta]|eukprot:KAG2440232.1 hypothetical protein HXX76_004344 [Chlamydomonas incerta]
MKAANKDTSDPLEVARAKGGSAGSGDFAAKMKAANKDTSDPIEVARARGEASAAARGQSSVRKFMPDIHDWFMENCPDEKAAAGKWKAVMAALPQLREANEGSLRVVYGRWKREQEEKKDEEE